MNNPTVVAVSSSAEHSFSKQNRPNIKLIAGIGVEGDAHAGKTVKHIYLAKQDATKPNLRQVHLIQVELLEAVSAKGLTVEPGNLGENITTRGVDLLALPTGTKLLIGAEAVIELTALRNPCVQIERFRKGLLKEVIDKDEDNNIIRKAGVMGIVLVGGEIRPEDSMVVELPPEPHHQLEYVW